jgi:FkbM family methyltransferase
MLMSGTSVLRSIGKKVYQHAFPMYRPLYAGYKAFVERAERRLLKKVLFPGAVVVDVGANIGIYSRFFSHCVGPAGAVHSFEPESQNFQRLQAATSRLSNIRVSEFAVGERSGNSKLYLSDTLAVDHRTYLTKSSARRAVAIQMIALDDYFKPGERVDLIKMDVQGYELQALRGAERVIRDNPEIKLLLEFWPYGLRQASAHWRDLIEALEEKGMVIKQVSVSGLIPFDSSSASESADWYVNLFASRS